MQRETLAIMFTDMVGSTDLLVSLGTARSIRLRHAHDELLRSSVREHGGQVADTAGDGVMAVFPTVTDAIKSALTIGARVDQYSQRIDAIAAFEVRIGIAVGEVSIEEGSYFGTAVIEAARLEPMASAGGILTTGTVKMLADPTCADLVEQAPAELRGLPGQVDIYQVQGRVGGTPSLPLQRDLVVEHHYACFGRAEELASLSQQWAHVSDGAVEVTLIVGEAGIGKSRLVAEYAKAAHAESAVVLFGSCDAELVVPYRPIVNALRHAAALDDELSVAVAGGNNRLSPLFASVGSAQDNSHDEVGRQQLFDAVTDLFARLVEVGPVALILEDLHWVSRETALLLRHLARSVPSGLHVVATFRDHELGGDHVLHSVLSDLAMAKRIDLHGFDTAEIADLIAAQPGATNDAATLSLAQRVQTETDGNAFLTVEVLRHLIGGDAPMTGSAGRREGALEIPTSVASVISDRIAGLGAHVGRVLEVAAVVGPTFDLEVVSKVLDQPYDEVWDCVEAATSAAVLTEADHPGYFSFAHSILRSTVLERVGPTRRSRIHLQAGEAFEGLPGNRAAELAYHFVAANDPRSAGKARTYLRQAALIDEKAMAWESAIHRYRQVIAMLDGEDDLSEEADVERAEVWLKLGLALRVLGDFEFRAAMVQVGLYARRAGRGDLLAHAAVGSTRAGPWFAESSKNDETLIRVCEDALQVVKDDPALRARVLSALAISLAFHPDRARREALVAEAQELAKTVGDDSLTATCLTAEFLALWDPVALERQQEIAKELQILGAVTGSSHSIFLGQFFDAYLHLCIGDLAQCDRILSQIEEPIATTGVTYFAFLVDNLKVGIDIMRCLPTAKESIDRLFESTVATAIDTTAGRGAQMGNLARAMGAFGTLAEAYETYSKANAEHAVWNYSAACAHLANGDRDSAEAAIARGGSFQQDYLWVPAVMMLAEAGLGLERPDLCRKAYDELLPYEGRVGVLGSGTLIYELSSTALGQAALGLGENEIAAEHLRNAVKQADGMGAPFFSCTARRYLARALKESEPEVAAEHLRDVLRIAGEHGLGGHLNDADAELAGLEGTVASRPET